jgi:hypothetical protein
MNNPRRTSPRSHTVSLIRRAPDFDAGQNVPDVAPGEAFGERVGADLLRLERDGSKSEQCRPGAPYEEGCTQAACHSGLLRFWTRENGWNGTKP